MTALDTMQNAEVGLYRPILKTPFGKVELPLFHKKDENFYPLNVRQFEEDNQWRLTYEKVI